LETLHLKACKLIRLFNNTGEEEKDLRSQILQDLFAKVGKNPQIIPNFYCDYGCHIYVGDNFYMNYGCVILDCNTVHIGDNVLCGPYVQIYTAYHPVDPNIRLTGKELAAPILIGNNVWIGGGVIICPGVTIGDNTTIGAGSVVTKNIPENVVAVGNPCQVIREL
ncbi:MAG TPA: sugar O-acetyltransferase, partial [Phormidium sp.]